jgi:hypothetical protein
VTLREEVIRRFFKIADVSPADDVMTFRWSPLSKHAVIEAWADEVIRQMEWARRGRFRTAGSCDAGTVCRGSEMDWIDPVCLAPPGWKP